MNRLLIYLTVSFALFVTTNCSAALTTPLDRLLRWAGAGWGDGYHARTDVTGVSTLPRTWQRHPGFGLPGAAHVEVIPWSRQGAFRHAAPYGAVERLPHANEPASEPTLPPARHGSMP